MTTELLWGGNSQTVPFLFPLSFIFYKTFPPCPCYSPPDKSISALIQCSRQRRIFVYLMKEMLLGHSFVEIGMQLCHNLKRSTRIIRSSFEKELIWTASLFSQLCPLLGTEAAQHWNCLFSSCLLPPFNFFFVSYLLILKPSCGWDYYRMSCFHLLPDEIKQSVKGKK